MTASRKVQGPEQGTAFEGVTKPGTIAEIILIAGTRVALGAGIGLLLSNKFNKDQRNAAGLALTIIGGLTTIPLALSVMGRKARATEIRPAA